MTARRGVRAQAAISARGAQGANKSSIFCSHWVISEREEMQLATQVKDVCECTYILPKLSKAKPKRQYCSLL
jgi:hypothetical protein